MTERTSISRQTGHTATSADLGYKSPRSRPAIATTVEITCMLRAKRSSVQALSTTSTSPTEENSDEPSTPIAYATDRIYRHRRVWRWLPCGTASNRWRRGRPRNAHRSRRQSARHRPGRRDHRRGWQLHPGTDRAGRARCRATGALRLRRSHWRVQR